MDFAEAIEATYRAFSGVAKPRAISGCPCCIRQKNLCNVLKKPLRDLTGDDLSNYASSVFLTLGDVSDFRYFLPRMLELSATELGWWPSPEVVVGKLKLAGFKDWPAAEREPTETLLGAWLERLLAPNSGEDELDSADELDALLCGIALGGLSLTPYVHRLLAPDARHSLRALYWANFNGKLGRVKLTNAFWSDNCALGDPLASFLEMPEVVRIATG